MALATSCPSLCYAMRHEHEVHVLGTRSPNAGSWRYQTHLLLQMLLLGGSYLGVGTTTHGAEQQVTAS